MATTTATVSKPWNLRLIRVYDCREIDEMTGSRIPLNKQDGEGHVCERCRKLHAKVYVIEDRNTKAEHEVGSTCCKRMFGWSPATSEVNAAEQREQEAAMGRAACRLVDWMMALPVPAIEDCGEASRIDRDFGMRVRVFGNDGVYFLFNPNAPDFGLVAEKLASGELQQDFADRYRSRKAATVCCDERIRNRAFRIYNSR